MSEISLSTGPPARSSGVLIDAEKIPASDLERRAERTRGAEQRRTGDTNRFDTGQPEPRDPSVLFLCGSHHQRPARRVKLARLASH